MTSLQQQNNKSRYVKLLMDGEKPEVTEIPTTLYTDTITLLVLNQHFNIRMQLNKPMQYFPVKTTLTYIKQK